MKANPARLEPASYPHLIDIPARFSDIDAQMHLNNVRIAEYYQEARVTFFRRFAAEEGYERGRDSRILVAHQSMDYLGEVQYPGIVSVGVGVARIGNTSYTLGLGMFQSGRCVGLSRCVMVYGNHAGPAPLPAPFRAILARNQLPPAAQEAARD